MARAQTFAYCEGPLPCPPGKSPFHIKGEFYRQMTITIDTYDERAGGALKAALEREGLREFMSQKFLASSLYDLLPLPRLFMVIAEVLGRDVRELTQHLGKSAIEMSMKGVYESLFARLTPKNFADRFVSIIPHVYDHAPGVLTRDPDGNGGTLVRDGMPLCVSEWWCLVTIPFVEVPLVHNGARDVRIDWKIDPRGHKSGIPLGKVTWKLRWT